MQFKLILGVVTVLCACSSSSGGTAVTAASDAGDGGGGGAEDASQAAPCGNKPQTNNGGSCTEPGIATDDAGDAGAPPIFCIDYTGSAQTGAGAQQSCKTMMHDFSPSPCATLSAAMPVGFCIRSCGTTQESVQYYYSAASAVDAQSQCQSITGDVWVAE